MPNWSINKIKFESWAGHGIERCENPQRGLEQYLRIRFSTTKLLQKV